MKTSDSVFPYTQDAQYLKIFSMLIYQFNYFMQLYHKFREIIVNWKPMWNTFHEIEHDHIFPYI